MYSQFILLRFEMITLHLQSATHITDLYNFIAHVGFGKKTCIQVKFSICAHHLIDDGEQEISYEIYCSWLQKSEL